MSVRDMVKRLLTEREDRRYEKLLQNRMVSYDDWLCALERDVQAVIHEAERDSQTEKREAGQDWQTEKREAEQDGRTEKREAEQDGRTESHEVKDNQAENVAELQNGCGYVVIRAGEGRFAAGFQGYVRSYFAAHPEAFILYGDEDVGNGGQGETGIGASERRLPWFKPDWSPDLLDSFFYFGSVVVLRRELFRRALALQGEKLSINGLPEVSKFMSFARREQNDSEEMAFYVVTDFAAYEVWIHQLVELAGGYEPGSPAVGHVAVPWFTGSCPEGRNRYLGQSSFLRKRQEMRVQDFRNGDSGQSLPALKGSDQTLPKVSIVILSKDHPEILEQCLRGCELGAKGQEGPGLSYEVILVDNGSSAKNRKRVLALVQKLTFSGCRITYLYRRQEFHFSRLCNLGAVQARGKLLFFLNDDVALCRQGCMEVLAALAERPWTGAVGMKLYYPDSVRIQHAGITNLPMGPVHKLQFLADDKEYYYGANRGRHNVLAVTAACLMVAREKYLEAGGFAEELPVAFNDVDLCFCLYELGYQNVCVNDMYAYHYESLSRGDDETPEKLERLLRERDKLYERHPALVGVDPYYSPHLNREGLDVAIRPAYLTAGNAVQKVQGRLGIFSLKGYRQDACVMVRVEECQNRKAVGYGVVLGDNNACYEKILLMVRIPEELPSGGDVSAGRVKLPSGRDLSAGMAAKPEPVEIYAVSLAGQYRPDLEENMPDQVKVGLSGFMVDMAKGVVPEGKYRLGMGVRNRVTGLRLMNWSNRIWEL